MPLDTHVYKIFSILHSPPRIYCTDFTKRLLRGVCCKGKILFNRILKLVPIQFASSMNPRCVNVTWLEREFHILSKFTACFPYSPKIGSIVCKRVKSIFAGTHRFAGYQIRCILKQQIVHRYLSLNEVIIFLFIFLTLNDKNYFISNTFLLS